MTKKFFFTFIIFFLILKSNLAFSIEPDIFVQSTVNRASQILSENMSKEDSVPKLELPQDLKELLWERACNLTTQKDSAVYKDIVLPLLFFKFVSDNFVEQQNI